LASTRSSGGSATLDPSASSTWILRACYSDVMDPTICR
jgi:hypothetical protein